MNDTSPEVEKIYREMLMARSGEDRFRMGLELFEMAKSMMLAGMKADGKGISRTRIFRRLYGNEFSDIEVQKIISALQSVD